MRLTPKHVGMKVNWGGVAASKHNFPGEPLHWETLKGFFKNHFKEECIKAGKAFSGLLNDDEWRVRKPQKKTRRTK